MKKVLTILMSMMLVMGISSPKVKAAMTTPSEEEIIHELKTHYVHHGKETTYTQDYTKKDAKTTYTLADIGQLSDETKNNALTYLNNYRYITGLPQVGYNSQLDQSTQAGVYLNYLSDSLSHMPAQSSVMSRELYEAGTDGTTSCNLAAGTLLTGSVYIWLDDSDDSNINDLGHRRWLLNPTLKNVAFGAAGGISAVNVMDYDRKAQKQDYAYPPREMPIELWGGDYCAWNYSFADEIDDNIAVTLTRKTSGAHLPPETWTFSKTSDQNDPHSGKFVINHETYGHEDAVIFRPNNIKYSSGDVFHVSISGSRSVEYDVHFFDGYRANSIILNTHNITLKKGDNTELKVTNIPENSSEDAYVWSSSNDQIAYYDQGTVYATGYGQATLTCQTHYGLTATCQVTVINPKDCPHNKDKWEIITDATCTRAGKKEKNCSICGAHLTKKIPPTGHKWSKAYIIKKATKKHKGKKLYYCENCFKKRYVTYALSELTIKAKMQKKGKVIVSWTKQKGIKKYRLAYRIKGTKKWSYKMIKGYTYTFKKLKAKTYSFKVQTVNGKKKGRWSSSLSVKIKG